MKRPRSGEGNGSKRAAAEAVAVGALSFLASDVEQLGRFLAATGIGPDAIRDAAREPGFLSGVLDYLSGDEALLIEFARHVGIEPSEVERARAALGGAWERDTP
jgi:hypothetical protein